MFYLFTVCLIVKYIDNSIYPNHKSAMHNIPWYIIAYFTYLYL